MIDRRALLGAGAAALTVRSAWAAPAGLPALGLAEAAAALRRGEASPVDLTRACLERIEALNPTLNAFITVTPERALAAARAAERELARGEPRSPLHGVPVALKDNIDTAGVRTTAASAAFATRVPATDAEVARRLSAAGAILLGKLNMDDCAYGVSSTSGHFGAVRNPWDTAHIAGGSSGGPAAAVAARLCFAALGTDTGGSIRQPAAYCGLTGLKPTYGLVSTRGVVPLSWSLDHVGPLCRSAADAAAVLQVLAGYDPGDPASVASAPADYPRALAADIKALRLGRPRGFYYEGLDPDVAAAVENALRELEAMGGALRDIDLPPVPALSVMFVEARAALGPERDRAAQGFSPAVSALIDMGARIDAASYARALRDLEQTRRAARGIFDEVDLLVTPTTPDTAMTIEASRSTSAVRGPPRSARNTTPFNIYGLPTVSVCCGFSKQGLPIGLQISGPPFAEGTVLALAHAYQQRTDWHRRAPGA